MRNGLFLLVSYSSVTTNCTYEGMESDMVADCRWSIVVIKSHTVFFYRKGSSLELARYEQLILDNDDGSYHWEDVVPWHA